MKWIRMKNLTNSETCRSRNCFLTHFKLWIMNCNTFEWPVILFFMRQNKEEPVMSHILIFAISCPWFPCSTKRNVAIEGKIIIKNTLLFIVVNCYAFNNNYHGIHHETVQCCTFSTISMGHIMYKFLMHDSINVITFSVSLLLWIFLHLN